LYKIACNSFLGFLQNQSNCCSYDWCGVWFVDFEIFKLGVGIRVGAFV